MGRMSNDFPQARSAGGSWDSGSRTSVRQTGSPGLAILGRRARSSISPETAGIPLHKRGLLKRSPAFALRPIPRGRSMVWAVPTIKRLRVSRLDPAKVSPGVNQPPEIHDGGGLGGESPPRAHRSCRTDGPLDDVAAAQSLQSASSPGAAKGPRDAFLLPDAGHTLDHPHFRGSAASRSSRPNRIRGRHHIDCASDDVRRTSPVPSMLRGPTLSARQGPFRPALESPSTGGGRLDLWACPIYVPFSRVFGTLILRRQFGTTVPRP